MFSVRPHERHDLRTTTTPKALTSYLPLILAFSSFAEATPVERDKRDNNDGQPQQLSPKIWVPVLIVIIVLFAIGMGTWRKYSWDQTRRFFSGNRRRTNTASTGPREITAAQLAGTINGDNQTPNAPTRRTRRPRRTPSQMSVTSLPEYNKEPGEEELVIFRGRDAEDATMPAARAMTSMEEERDEDERYSPMPSSPNSTPLLQDDDAQGDLSMQSLALPPGEDMPRPSYDTSAGSHETSSLMRADAGTPDPRGEAPPYFEVVDVQAEPTPSHQHARTPSSPGNNTSNAQPNRRSGFRTLLNRMSMASHPHSGHNRNESTGSTFSSNMSHGHEGTLHRSTPSGSGSLLSGSMFRTLSRQRSNHTLNSNRLNSPSLISLNSISAPLTHTLTRTEFTYPKSGPTPEQLKVISSRDTFARFGVPYGPDAVAFAASSSRQDLMIPPPDFEEVTSSEQSPRSAGSANPSRLRSSSNAAQLADAPSSPSPGSSSSSNNSAAQSTDDTPSVPLPQADTAVPQPSTSPVSNEDSASLPSVQSSSISSIAKNHSSVSSSKSTHKPASENVSEFGNLTVPPLSSNNNSTVSSVRSESRASVFSYQSYATAAESVTRRSERRASPVTSASFIVTDTDDDGEETEYESQPSTPRIGGQHQLELTDATVVPRDDRRDTVVPSLDMSSQQQQ